MSIDVSPVKYSDSDSEILLKEIVDGQTGDDDDGRRVITIAHLVPRLR